MSAEKIFLERLKNLLPYIHKSFELSIYTLNLDLLEKFYPESYKKWIENEK